MLLANFYVQYTTTAPVPKKNGYNQNASTPPSSWVSHNFVNEIKDIFKVAWLSYSIVMCPIRHGLPYLLFRLTKGI